MRTHRKDAGFSLAALIFFATAASILLAAAVPAYQMQAKREMEEELIFRGEEYMRAIQKYQRKFGIYPPSVEQLVSTNGLRFLRRPYVDPVTGKEFRLIAINPDGSLTGSKLFMQNTPSPLFGNTQTFGAQNPQQQNPQQQMQQQMQQAQQQLQQGQQQAQQLQQFSQGGQRGFQQAGQQPQTASQGRGGGGGFSANVPQGQRGQQPTGAGGINPAGGTPVAFGGIIGVASDSGEESIKVYNTRQKYDEWEFLAILGQPGQQGQQPNPQQNPQQNPNSPQQQNPFGGQRQNNPFGNAPTNPLGGTPTTSPFGPVGGQRQPQNPFGFGGPQPQPQPQPPGR